MKLNISLRNIKKRKIYLFIIVICLVIIVSKQSNGTITSITQIPANPTNLSNGLSYYLAGMTYNFTVTVIDPNVIAWNEITDVRITLLNTTNIVVSIGPLTGVGPHATTTAGPVDATANVAGTFNNFTVTFAVTIRWDTNEIVWGAAGGTRNVTASATTNNPAINTLTTTTNISYGVSSTIKINNFSQDGNATDAYVNPYHTTFNITGAIVYNIPGATNNDKVYFVNGGSEVASARLLVDGFDTTGLAAPVVADVVFTNDNVDDLSFVVPAVFFDNNSATWAGNPLGNHNWSVRVFMTAAGGPEVSSNVGINCDRIEITQINIINGGGADIPYYIRGINVPGTQLQILAQTENGTGTMIGNTTVRISDNAGTPNTYDVVIPNGTNTGVLNLIYPVVPGDIPDFSTTPLTYNAIRVFGGAYDGHTSNPEGQRIPGSVITQPAGIVVYWDSNDPPGNNAPAFTTFQATPWSSTADSFTINWNAVTTGGPNFDAGFFTYRIYYQLSTVVNVVDVGTGGVYLALGNIATNTVDITGLAPLTDYPFWVSAVDVFGNEVVLLNRLNDTANTKPSSLTVTISDGITLYEDTSFTADQLATARPVRNSAIRVTLYLVTGGNEPEELNLILGDNTLEPANILAGITYSIASTKTAPNTWTSYIPTSNVLMTTNASLRFIVETKYQGVSSYIDHDADYNPTEQLPAGEDFNNWEWTFSVSKKIKVTPWPVRILNNVITSRNPKAYPSYYLTDDANVTIRVYDIKGRAVVTLLENAYRKSGQNIKEQGWSGTNRGNKKLGVGLYYIHIRAKRTSDGKVILNKFKKVVIAR